jgi:DNA-binding GntR family transcriptional regulator
MPRSTTRGETAFLDLRRDILSGTLLPGQRLQFSELSARYTTSVGALREALSRLAEQGLVISEPQQGFRVVPVSPDDLRDLTAARVEIETMALRRALAAGDLAWEARLVAAHHILYGTPQLSDEDSRRVTEEWTDAHRRFHEVLLEACDIRRLREIAASLRDAAELYRRWSRYLRTEQDRDIAGEHEEMLRAALARDVDRAVALLTQHIEYTTNAVLATGKMSADADAPDPEHATETAEPAGTAASARADGLRDGRARGSAAAGRPRRSGGAKAGR